ncbi:MULTISPECIES: hypothetical protein [unclassified Veillonella]|uniref:hypothetical protein n=1 Tax=unclassified Veillonella TaxID=2630086 RepID=UPI00044BA855|nr:MULTISPECIES: hypothetical protein [unclassified Veillonella]EUB27471.1 hypothetical protein HMPREF1504_0740 [Veillonella sp. ICM51a]MBS6649204.1 hypothetical protein [Veillonella sp.]
MSTLNQSEFRKVRDSFNAVLREFENYKNIYFKDTALSDYNENCIFSEYILETDSIYKEAYDLKEILDYIVNKVNISTRNKKDEYIQMYNVVQSIIYTLVDSFRYVCELFKQSGLSDNESVTLLKTEIYRHI